jgi:hypothetical protein
MFAVHPEKSLPQGLTSKITMDLAAGFDLPAFVAGPSLLVSPWLLDILADSVVSLETVVIGFRCVYLSRLRPYCATLLS